MTLAWNELDKKSKHLLSFTAHAYIMEHSAAILEDAGKAIDAAADAQNKRKRDEPRQNGDNKRHKKRDLGRGEYIRSNLDKRDKIKATKERPKPAQSTYGVEYTQEEIEAEERRPKRKVAVMIGYAGTGYKGMQISPLERTIEGDLFTAFIKAGAISKANADDPKKAGLVRCARTDKGVHAAGNMISLKLIVEDEDIVEKINAELTPQIRIWGIERTVGSFSCYNACDSRWYEYLIPSYAFLPPHPSSWLAKKLELIADEVGDREAYEARQQEVKGYWEEIEARYIDSVVASIAEDIRDDVVAALRGEDEDTATQEAAKQEKDVTNDGDAEESKPVKKGAASVDDFESKPEETALESKPTADDTSAVKEVVLSEADIRTQRLRAATKKLRQAYMTAKRHYRLPEQRIERIREALQKYVGTRNYHNYTVQKAFGDPSVKRNIKSFVVNGKPVLIGEGEDSEKTEWLSLKVHGQSFMMHQIRKMIGMVALLIRCGSSLKTMDHSFGSSRYSIPKVPGLGLMLERPVFDSYNKFQAPKHDRPQLVFDKYEDKIEDFKRREIYGRMFSEEEEKGEFSRFFNHVDNFREPCFLFLSSKGLDATEGHGRKEGYGEKND